MIFVTASHSWDSIGKDEYEKYKQEQKNSC
ncbi:hypothetical protein SAMN06265348_102465 [Pedobacter westerhofensis]|uniref:Uncharacterized protein n=1 Tax=Pedobacter westerhofensis TaxID=425512 RepID=A0A521BQQ5_9SPHI|nr:hypothetical protein SAMN06265348_102465 [Pedobacter westerhofensis]